MSFSIPAISREYVHAPITTDVPLDTQTIEVTFLPQNSVPDGTTAWLAAEWVGSVGTTRSWRLLIGPTTTAPLTPGQYSVWSRVTDTAEQVVRKHDIITIN